MQHRPLALGVFAVLLVAAIAAFFLLKGGEPDPVEPMAPAGGVVKEPPQVAVGPVSGDAQDAALRREAVSVGKAAELDPEILAALSGFRGRVVDHKTHPVAETGVRIYRFSLDKLLGPADLMEGVSVEPQWLAGETRTGADGTFQITGVWPRAIFLLLAGEGSDAPTHRIVQQVPAPGEIVDLGDVVLLETAIVTGIVVDEDGEGVGSALVRGADLPGQLAGLFPVERFDPEGALLSREPQTPFQVLLMPPWVKRVFEHLPIPSTRSDATGRFRLAGLVAGSNMIATTKEGMLSDVKASVMLKAGQTKDLGRIRLKRGEELVGRVLDSLGKPVPGAEFVAGSTLAVAPIDLASRIGVTDAEGRVRRNGFAEGRITAAARRGPGQPWVMAEPQPILKEVVVTLPAVFSVTVSVTRAEGALVTEPKLVVYGGPGRQGLLEMATFGFHQPLDVQKQTTKLEDGRTRIAGLEAGSYTILGTAAGFATAKVSVTLEASDQEVQLALPARRTFAVRVVDTAGKGIRSAEIFGKESGRGEVVDMPVLCGRTDAEGRLSVDRFASESIRLSAVHPRYGSVQANAKDGQGEIVMTMLEPGSIEGIVTEAGKPPAPGRWTVVTMCRPAQRGAIEDTPQFSAPDREGVFRLRGLQPGKYRLELIKSLDALTSPGSVVMLMQEAWMGNESVRTEADVQSGQVARVTLDAAPKEPEGPTGRITGSVTVDDRPAAGYSVTGWSHGDAEGRRQRRLAAKVEPNGRFDLGLVPVGSVQLSVSRGDSMFGGRGGDQLFHDNYEVAQGEVREVTIEVRTSSVEGIVVRADGSAATGCQVNLHGQVVDSSGKKGGNTWQTVQVDAEGRFRFERLPEGDYSVDAQPHSGGKYRARLEGVVLRAGQPVTDLRVQLVATQSIKGRIDLSVFGDKKPGWLWLQLVQVQAEAEPGKRMVQSSGGGSVRGDNGSFEIDGVKAGTWRLQLHWDREAGPAGVRELWGREPIVLGPGQDIDNLLVQLVSREQAGIDR